MSNYARISPSFAKALPPSIVRLKSSPWRKRFRVGRGPFVASERFPAADITALVAIDFATNALKLGIPDEAVNVKRWYGVVSKRADVNA
jgi:glutathione S-transferase